MYVEEELNPLWGRRHSYSMEELNPSEVARSNRPHFKGKSYKAWFKKRQAIIDRLKSHVK